jgi:hypothetical protein
MSMRTTAAVLGALSDLHRVAGPVADDHHVVTWPILIAVYYRLARREEREAEAVFGDVYRAYGARVPMFVPRLCPSLGGVNDDQAVNGGEDGKRFSSRRPTP